MCIPLLTFLLLFQVAAAPGVRRVFHWDWHQIQYADQSLEDSKVSDADRAALMKTIEAYIGPPDPKNPDLDSEDRVRIAVQSAKVKIVRLNQDRKEPAEVVVAIPLFCSGGGGNCPLSFLRRTPHGYRLLLDAIGQGFVVQKTATNGFSDLVVNMHSSATDQWLKVYRYARGRYWRSACYDADWAPLENGVIHELREPRITPSSCK
jgi:hypothetical protein